MRKRQYLRRSGLKPSTILANLTVAGLCATLISCAKEIAGTKYSLPPDRVRPDGISWRWKDYSNRVWISESYLRPKTGANTARRTAFSYSPNTGISQEEAIAIRAFNMFGGGRAERHLLAKLFEEDGNPLLDHSDVVTNGKAFHIYTFTNLAGETCTVYFDATHYHHLW